MDTQPISHMTEIMCFFKTARTLTFYVQGDWERLGDPKTNALTLRALLPNQLHDQFCFRTPDAIASLEFIRSERYGDNQPSF